jgi:hypothetical protein
MQENGKENIREEINMVLKSPPFLYCSETRRSTKDLIGPNDESQRLKQDQ